jgi:hypothetical protein
MTWRGALDWLGGGGALLAAAGAVWAAIAATRLVKGTQRQVELTQQEVFGADRPVVIPTTLLDLLQGSEGGYVDLDAQGVLLELKNVGRGVALNIRAVLFGPIPSGPPAHLARRQSAWLIPPMASGQERAVELHAGGTGMGGDASVDREGGLSLHAPGTPSRENVLLGSSYVIAARLTVTYHDIYGRKHASICDFDVQARWHHRAYRDGIHLDLEDLEDAVGAARKAALTRR